MQEQNKYENIKEFVEKTNISPEFYDDGTGYKLIKKEDTE
jgi:hypothetical protein